MKILKCCINIQRLNFATNGLPYRYLIVGMCVVDLFVKGILVARS